MREHNLREDQVSYTSKPRLTRENPECCSKIEADATLKALGDFELTKLGLVGLVIGGGDPA